MRTATAVLPNVAPADADTSPGLPKSPVASSGSGISVRSAIAGTSISIWRRNNAAARATGLPSCSMARFTRRTLRPRPDCTLTRSGAIGTGRIKSTVNRPQIRRVSATVASATWASNAAGAPPCWASGSHGPRARVVGTNQSPSATKTLAGCSLVMTKPAATHVQHYAPTRQQPS